MQRKYFLSLWKQCRAFLLFDHINLPGPPLESYPQSWYIFYLYPKSQNLKLKQRRPPPTRSLFERIAVGVGYKQIKLLPEGMLRREDHTGLPRLLALSFKKYTLHLLDMIYLRVPWSFCYNLHERQWVKGYWTTCFIQPPNIPPLSFKSSPSLFYYHLRCLSISKTNQMWRNNCSMHSSAHHVLFILILFTWDSKGPYSRTIPT